MSDYYTDTEPQWDDADSGTDTQPEPVKAARRSSGTRARGRRRSRTLVTSGQAETVLDRYEALSAATADELSAVAAVLGSTEHDVRTLTVTVVAGAGVKHAQAMEDLLDVAGRDNADRDMAALTLAVGPAGIKRLRAAWDLAQALSDGADTLDTNPVQAARQLAGAAVDVEDVLSTARVLLG
ncbi:hypothetical protein [Actinomyces gaoshouyii]|uniref:hypothetical protein n=1 Tax=Actinomyces gaoshouyii TaxID=1960083 RepID=UPI0009BE18B3|nr:hypothetical protein [Actinomyces gaoshouyii]ARD42529.1 hypothetical protein B6G06_09380 [Actinomyces gaoshouyii]